MILRPTATDRQIVSLALPALGALVAEPLFLLVDSAYVGRLGPTPQAALGIGGVIVVTVVSLSIFLAYGTTGQVAREIGAGRRQVALRAGVDACWLAAALGVLTAIGLLLAAGPLVAVFDPPPGVSGPAQTYVRISALGIPSMLVVLAGFGVLRGALDTVTPLRVAVAGALANIVLNGILIYPVGLGLAGAALGTVLAQTGMAAWLVAVVGAAARREAVALAPQPGGMLRSAVIGGPLLVRTAAMRIALLVAAAVAAGLGTASLAAYQASFAVWTFLAMVLDALAIAAQAMVAQALGSGDVEVSRDVGRRLLVWGVLAGVLLGVALLLLRHPLALALSDDPQVRDLITDALLVAAVLQPLAGLVFALDGVLIGAGDGVFLAAAAVLATVVFVPVAQAAGEAGGGSLVALWWAVGAWMAVRGLTLGLRLRSGRWMVTGATR